MYKLKFAVLSMFLANNYLLAEPINVQNKNIGNISAKHQNEEVLKSFLNKNYSPFLIDKKILKEYYQLNDFKAFWTNETGVKEIALSFVEKVKNDPVLKPKIDTNLKLVQVIEALNSVNDSLENKLKVEFMLTELFDKYSNYLQKGTINWKVFKDRLAEIEKNTEVNGQWDRYEINKDSKKILKSAIDENDISVALKELDTNYPNVEKLTNVIADLEKIVANGDYIKVPPFKSLRLGDVSPDVKFLRQRLMQSGDLTKTCENSVNATNVITNNISADSQNQSSTEQNNSQTSYTPTSCEEVFDEDLKNAVISFQKTHGLFADGIVGLQSQKFLNTSAKEKISQIRLNIERMRWLPRDFGEQYLIINIPDYRLKMIENDNIKLNMAVVVGETKHPTPIFSDNMSYIVLNPKWNIPENIAKKEILPKLMKDPNYLASKGIDIYQGWHPESEKIGTTEVIDTMILQDIEAVPNFRFTQGPGEENPLGKMKFMFPNKHAVYLHDTPAKSLFNNARRAYSHGCIRLSKPDLLLSTIANDNKNINLDKVSEILKQPNEKSIGLNKKIPVHIIYLTSWVDEEGKIQFREDIYNYDKMQKELF